VSANPAARSKSITTPQFAFAPFNTKNHPRIADFLAEFLFERANTVGLGNLFSETVESSDGTRISSAVFTNHDRSVALYHNDFGQEAYLPPKGVVHRDYFSLLKQIATKEHDALQSCCGRMTWQSSSGRTPS
jgi:hypothetical protein